jgi:putative FmdB family regulatory protein
VFEHKEEVMPTYDYLCDKCGRKFEIWQKITDKPLEVCPGKGCGGRISRDIGGGGGFILKGSGFYATDYRSSEYKKKKENESSAPKPASTESDKKKPDRALKKDA